MPGLGAEFIQSASAQEALGLYWNIKHRTGLRHPESTGWHDQTCLAPLHFSLTANLSKQSTANSTITSLDRQSSRRCYLREKHLMLIAAFKEELLFLCSSSSPPLSALAEEVRWQPPVVPSPPSLSLQQVGCFHCIFVWVSYRVMVVIKFGYFYRLLHLQHSSMHTYTRPFCFWFSPSLHPIEWLLINDQINAFR